MLPSARLIILVMAAAPLFLGGALYDPLTGIGVVYLAILALCMAVDAVFLPRRSSITVKRRISERVSLVEPARVALDVENGTSRRVRIELAESLPENMECRPSVCACSLAPGGRTTLAYRLIARKRGRYALSDLDVRVLPRLGLFYRQFRLSLPAEVHVFPNLVNIKRYELQLRRGLREQGIGRMRQIGLGTNFESLRLYTHGDDMSRVDWKATAKRGRLITRNYEPERQQSVLVAIDCGRATAGEFEGISRLDYVVNAALMLGYVALRQGDWFSLVAFSDRIESYLPPIRGVYNVDRVARALYELEPRLAESDYSAACRFIGLKHRKRSLVCLMTDVIDRDASAVIIGYMARFARYHLPLAVTLANPEIREVVAEPLARTPDPYRKAAALDVISAREEALQLMRIQGVSVIDVPPRSLTPELINRYLLIKSTRRL